MTPEVKNAVDEICAAFRERSVEIVEDREGGAVVTVSALPLDGSPYAQADTFVGFHITHPYPYADVYPHFVRHDLNRRDGKAFGEGFSIGTFHDKPAVQISRRSNKLDPATNTALLKLQKVLRWLKSRP